MRQIFSTALALLLAISCNLEARTTYADKASIENAYTNQQSNVQLQAYGKVEKVLADDSQGSRHQRFIVRINAKLTILIAHNIDLARRIPDLKPGDLVEFYGEYEWNKKGGVVHWTHRDPSGRHLAGWLKHNGITYQ